MIYRECLEQEEGSFLKNFDLNGVIKLKRGFFYMIISLIGLIIHPVFAVIFGISSLINIVLGIVFIVINHKQHNNYSYLTENGNLLIAKAKDLSGGEYNMPFFSSFNHLYIKAIHIDDNGKEQIFRSPPLWIYPIPYLDQMNVKVYYENENMKRYFVDIDGSVNPDVRIPSEYLERTR
jgi:hypothetical protein